MKHLAGRGDYLTECFLTSVVAGELTADLELMTCKDCRTELIKRGVCPDCGEKRLAWGWGWAPQVASGISPGRLYAGDVQTVFYLACEYCSATLVSKVDAETVAAALTENGWRP